MSDELPNIWMMQTENDVDGLVKALAHPSAQLRKRAAVALRIVSASRAAPALKRALDEETDPHARTAIAAALAYLEPEQRKQEPASQAQTRPQTRTERLIQHLTGPRPDLALQAAHALAELKDLSAVPALVTVFRNQRQPPNIRLAAAEALLAMNSAPAEVTLLGALKSEKWHLRRNGAAILGKLQAEWAVQPLAKALYDPNELVARTARAALRHIATPEARQALADAKHALIDTTDATNSGIISKAKRIDREKLGKLATAPLDPDFKKQVQDKRKKGTSDLKPPRKKPQTGALKAPVDAQSPPPDKPDADDQKE